MYLTGGHISRGRDGTLETRPDLHLSNLHHLQMKSTLQTFFLAMVLNPEVMKKAQEELDRVIGKDRLQDFSDKDDLPYIDAIVKELLRWCPPAPICVPNKVTQDDAYRGYFIPRGATVIQNVWAIFRDPTIYADPDAFNPDRFMKGGKIDPLVLNPEDRVFGTGRRSVIDNHSSRSS